MAKKIFEPGYHACNCRLYRVIAKENIVFDVNGKEIIIHAGDFGGYVSNVNILDPDDNSWITRSSTIIGDGIRITNSYIDNTFIRYDGGDLFIEDSILDKLTTRPDNIPHIYRSSLREVDLYTSGHITNCIISDSRIDSGMIDLNESVILSSTLTSPNDITTYNAIVINKTIDSSDSIESINKCCVTLNGIELLDRELERAASKPIVHE